MENANNSLEKNIIIELAKKIAELEDLVKFTRKSITRYNERIEDLKHQKKQMENYLNEDSN